MFAENKWYRLKPEMVNTFIDEAPGINKGISEYLGDKAFEVYINRDGNVHRIRFFQEDWVTRPEAVKIDGFGSSWFYSYDREEYECFTEYDEYPDNGPEPEVKNCIIIFTDALADSAYDNGSRRVIGGSDPVRYTETEAKTVALELLNESKDENAVVEIFSLQSTAKVQKEVKFS